MTEWADWRSPDTAIKGETMLGGFVNHDHAFAVTMVAWVGPLSTHWESRDPFSYGFGIRKPEAIRPLPPAPTVADLPQ